MASSTPTELTLCLVLALCGGAARAEPPDAEARATAAEGRRAYEAGDFKSAITRYEEAQALKPAPGLLFNLAQSHRRAGNTEKAVFYLRQYLETKPPEPQARMGEALLLRLHERRLLELSTQRLELEKTRLSLAQKQLACPEAPPPPPVTTQWWFWGLVGAAVAGTAVAVGVGIANAPPPGSPAFQNAR